MSEQPNLQEILQSLQQPTGLATANGPTDSKPFSIRQYVLACRQKDIFHSWPFPEKYLHIFLCRSIYTVLPPFEPHDSAILSLRGRPKRPKISEKNKEDNAGSCQTLNQTSMADQEKGSKPECTSSKSCETVSEICSQDCETNEHEDHNVNSCIGFASSAKRKRVKRKWGKGKHKKKRRVVSILEAVKPPSSENSLRMTRSRRGLSKPLDWGVRESETTINSDQNCDSELTEDQCLKNKLVKDDRGDADTDTLGTEKRRVSKRLLRNCSLRNSGSTNDRGKRNKIFHRNNRGTVSSPKLVGL